MKTFFHGRTILAAALALSAAAPARAGDDDAFAAALGEVRSAVAGETQTIKNRNLYRLATQESGPNDPLLLMQKPMIDLIKKVEPSVVFLVMDIPAETSDKMAAPAPAPMPGTPAPDKPGQPDGKKKKKGGQALCTGFFTDAAKYLNRPSVITTNAHCVEKLAVGAEISVGLYDGNDNRPKMTKGKVLAYGDSSAAKDVAFVELDDASLNRRPLPLWWKLDVGEQVVAIGNPLGLTFSVSKGIISALERGQLRGTFVLDANQSDVAVNPGNSGGPLFNMWGSVVGINTMIATNSGGFEGISLSVPANYIVEAMKQYARTGNLKIGALQVVLKADADAGTLSIQAVTAGGPGEAAHLQAGDQVLRVDGVDVSGLTADAAQKAFLAHVKYMSPGEKTKLVVRRNGQDATIEATLGEPKAPEPPRPEWAPIPPNPKKQPKADPSSYVIAI